MEIEEQLRQALTSPWPMEGVLMVVTGMKDDGVDRARVYRMLERLHAAAEERQDTYQLEALAGALQVVAGYCPPEQKIWEGVLEFGDDRVEV